MQGVRAMGQSDAEAGGIVDFVVAKSNPGGGTVVRFTLADPGVKLTTSKMIRSVLCDAIQQWIDSERSDLNTNGDAHVKGAEEFPGVGDGFSAFSFNFGDKLAEITLTSKSNISVAGNITASIPFADTI
jgi:hypothetical protein